MNASKIALVTGANRGIGRAAAERLAAGGYHVLVAAREAASAQAVVDAIAAAGGSAEALALDVASPAAVAAAAAQVAERHPRLDVLVNNAGIMVGAEQTLLQGSRADLERALAVNALGAYEVTQALLPLLRKSPSARVVNVSSTAGSIADTVDWASPFAGFEAAPYRLSKAALNAITALTARALRRDKIKVNAICPGWVRTDMGGAAAPRLPQQAAETIWRYATLPDDGPTGGFFDERGAVAW